jgi:hypothetical protein
VQKEGPTAQSKSVQRPLPDKQAEEIFLLETPLDAATNGRSHDRVLKKHSIRLGNAVLRILTHPQPRDEQIRFFRCQNKEGSKKRQ